MEKTFGSTCHGAGRAMSRTAAKLDGAARKIDKELEARGEYPDDRMGDAIDTQGAVDNVGIGIEVAFPIVVAENDQRRSGSAILVRSKRPAKDWLDPEHGKEIRGDAAAFDALRLAGGGCGDTFVIISGDSLKRARLIPQHLVAGIREGVGYTGLAFTKKDQTAGLGIGQRTQEGGIDERKNRGIGADRDREGADGRGGEEAVSAENPGRIMEVLPDGLDHTGSLA